MSRLIIVRGLPGSGKSTFAHKAFNGALVLENDMYHIEDGFYIFNKHDQTDAVYWCLDMAKNAMLAGMDVVVSNTFTRREFIEPYEVFAKEHGITVKVYHMTGSYENCHEVPEDVIKRMKNNFQTYDGEFIQQPDHNKDWFLPEDTEWVFKKNDETELVMSCHKITGKWTFISDGPHKDN